MADALIIDDLPNTLVDEEGFKFAAFRYEDDMKNFKRLTEGFAFPPVLYTQEEYDLLATNPNGTIPD